MKNKIAIILQARLNSQRCKNKMLRSFANSSLFEIQLNKMSKLSDKSDYNFYCAVGEKPFYKILNNYKTIKLKRVPGKSDRIFKDFGNVEIYYILDDESEIKINGSWRVKKGAPIYKRLLID